MKLDKANLLRILGAILVALIAGEGLLRLFPQVLPPQEQLWLYERGGSKEPWSIPDPELGLLTKPRHHERETTMDYDRLTDTDSRGFDNKEPWPEKADILFLGDSLLGGLGYNFPSLLGERLPKTRIVNLSLAGASPEHQYRIYRRFGESLHPGLVISCLYLKSDVNNAIDFYTWLKEGQGTDYNYFRTHGRGREVTFSKRVKELFRGSYLCRAAMSMPAYWVSGGDDGDRVKFPDGSEILLSLPTIERLCQGASRQDAAVESFFRSLESLQKLVVSQGGTFRVVLIPSKEELYGSARFPKVLQIAKMVRQYLDETHVSYLDLYDFIQQQAQQHPPYYSRDIHLNHYGHQLVAERLAAWLAEQGLIKLEPGQFGSPHS